MLFSGVWESPALQTVVGRLILSLMAFTVFDIAVVHDLNWFANHAFGLRFLANYAASLAFLASIFAAYLVFQPKRKNVYWICCSVLLSLPLIAELTHFKVYNKSIDILGFDFASKNKAETFRYFIENTSLIKSIAALALCATVLKSLQSISLSAKSRRVVGVVSAIFAIFLPALAASNWYSVSLFQHGNFSFVVTFLEHISTKQSPIQVERPLLKQMDAPLEGIPNIIWVIGESAAKDHMQIYGYTRKTTPELQKLKDKKRIKVFEDMLAVGNKTMLAVPYTLFGLEGPDPDGRIYKSPSIFNYAKARGLKTGFVSAQDIRWYRFDRLVVDRSLDVVKAGEQFGSNVTVRDGADDIAVLEKGVVPFLEDAKRQKKPAFLVYQMNGSHYPYNTHSPAHAKVFLPEESANSINSYDNSILYTDRTLGRLLKWIDKNLENTWVFYVSDHGQELGEEKGGIFHAGYSDAVIKPPFFVYHSGDGLNLLKAKEDSPLSQIDLLPTALQLMGMKPQFPIDGHSLLQTIPENRMRICSEYMPTFSNNPHAALLIPGKPTIKLDFRRKQVVDGNEKRIMALEDMDTTVMSILRLRL
jgi:glucan phosphoethanolaminetransferase (alkaline phosphatase superfamily)